MPQITTHLLDTTLGLPCPNIQCTLLSYPTAAPGTTIALASGTTNADGRITAWQRPNHPGTEVDVKVEHGKVYGLRFETRNYYEATKGAAAAGTEQGMRAFFPWIDVVFEIDTDGGNRKHWHIPVLLGRYSFSTYRGS